MTIRSSIATLSAVAVLAVGGCTAVEAVSGTSSSEESTASTESTESSAEDDGSQGGRGGGPGSEVDVESVTTEAELVALIQDAYGDGSLDLHRGHQPVQDVLDEVLTISHDELHVRLEEQGQNLAAVAEDIGVEPQTLIDALVESRSAAIDTLLEAGTITEAEAEAYTEALFDAFTFRVTWDGETEMPTVSEIDA